MFHELGYRVPFTSGSIARFRGHELAHPDTEWKGKFRFTIVHTIHEAVKKYAFRKTQEAGSPLGTKEEADAQEEVYDSCEDARQDDIDDDYEPEEWDNKLFRLDSFEDLRTRTKSARERSLSDEEAEIVHASKESKKQKDNGK
jgi:hypothetical protein